MLGGKGRIVSFLIAVNLYTFSGKDRCSCSERNVRRDAVSCLIFDA